MQRGLTQACRCDPTPRHVQQRPGDNIPAPHVRAADSAHGKRDGHFLDGEPHAFGLHEQLQHLPDRPGQGFEPKIDVAQLEAEERAHEKIVCLRNYFGTPVGVFLAVLRITRQDIRALGFTDQKGQAIQTNLQVEVRINQKLILCR